MYHSQVARWVRMHPKASDVRWRSEHCWIYDHPRAGTVYSHGFLFPSEVTRIRHETTHGLTPAGLHLISSSSTANSGSGSGGNYPNAADTDPALTHSTVSRFGKHYHPPAQNLTTEQEVEALIEGSALSRLRDETVGGANGQATQREVESAWRRRESRRMRTIGVAAAGAADGVVDDTGAVCGTVVVHFIKRNEWFLETALAFLEDEPAPPPLEDEGYENPHWTETPSGTSSGPSRPGTSESGGNRVETDLSGKNPIDLSNLDPEPEVIQPAPKKTPEKPKTTDFQHKHPIDISHLDDIAEVIEDQNPEVPTTPEETLPSPSTPTNPEDDFVVVGSLADLEETSNGIVSSVKDTPADSPLVVANEESEDFLLTPSEVIPPPKTPSIAESKVIDAL